MRLNSRLAPDVYRGVRAVVPAADGLRIADEDDPAAIEYAVEMRRYADEATLDRRLAAGAAGEPEVQDVARRLARFHAGRRDPAGARAGGGRPRGDARRELRHARTSSPSIRRSSTTRGDWLTRSSPRRRAELGRRARSGSVRDGHGDLRAEHVVLERGIEIVDCVEFDPALREIDVGLDLAFLAMDLRRFDERLARALVTAYREAGGNPGDDALLAFFAAQRALIRAKVALMRASQVSGADADRRSAAAARLLRSPGDSAGPRDSGRPRGRLRRCGHRQVDAGRRAGGALRSPRPLLGRGPQRDPRRPGDDARPAVRLHTGDEPPDLSRASDAAPPPRSPS